MQHVVEKLVGLIEIRGRGGCNGKSKRQGYHHAGRHGFSYHQASLKLQWHWVLSFLWIRVREAMRFPAEFWPEARAKPAEGGPILKPFGNLPGLKACGAAGFDGFCECLLKRHSLLQCGNQT